MLDYVLRRAQSSSASEPHEHPHFNKKYAAKKFYRSAEIVREWAEGRYLSRGTEGLFKDIPAANGRLEEWAEEEPEVDFE